MENQLTLTLLIAGFLAGAVNFFITYLELPFQTKPSPLVEEDEWPKPKKLWIAILGYLLVGVAGAFLTPLLDALIGLKGYYTNKNFLVAFGYGLVLGYSTNRLLVGLLDSILKKLSKVDSRLSSLETNTLKSNTHLSNYKSNDAELDSLSFSEDLKKGEHYPKDKSEIAACGKFTAKIVRDSEDFKKLIVNNNANIIFKDEERTGADRIMNNNLNICMNKLASKVRDEWKNGSNPKYKLRVTEAWDENNEHSGNSLHYEARAADINLYDIQAGTIDTTKLGRLSSLAIDSGFDWIWYEDDSHVHVSCKK